MNFSKKMRLRGIAPAVLLAMTTTAPALVAAPAMAAKSTKTTSAAPNIPYTRETLPNGLTLIVHEDHKAPVVAISIWYHIGSGDEPAGKTGFAHLFEHLMFSGSEHHSGSYFAPFEIAGATGLNGTTWFDRTNYFETVPTTAVDMALWMESDRMGHLLGAIGDKELVAQRGVVQNEKRQGLNAPYGRMSQNVLSNIFPANHPYQHDTIGSMADLDAASLEDVKNWFRANYGAANVTLVLAGDITPAQAKAKVMQYFGDIPAGPPVAHQQPWAPTLAAPRTGVQHDNIPQPRVVRSWVGPGLSDDDATRLQLVMSVLGGGKASRLYQRLVVQDKLADNIGAEASPFALAGMPQISVDLKPGVEPARVEKVVDEEMRKLLAKGLTQEEVERAKTGYRGAWIRGLEKANAKATVLAEGQVYRGDPGAYKRDLAVVEGANAASLKMAAMRWLGKPDYRLQILPAGKGFNPDAEDAKVVALGPIAGRPAAKAPPAADYHVTPSTVDRGAGVPKVDRFPDLTFPDLQRARLKNGIEVVLAERHSIPVTNVRLIFDSGFAADPKDKPGIASFTAAMMGESTRTLDAREIARREEMLDAQIDVSCGRDSCSGSVSALNDKLKPSLALLADRVRNPAFNAADMARVRAQVLSSIAQEKKGAAYTAIRILPGLLYGTEHPYGHPNDGNETVVNAFTAQDLADFHRSGFRPDALTIAVVGDTTLARILPELEAAFGDWQAPATPRASKALGTVAPASKTRVILVDRPNSPQTQIMAGLLAPPTSDANALALGIANDALGGSFTSRINMNLREDKHWAYGAYSTVQDAVGQRPFVASAPVQTDKTAESVVELILELRDVVRSRPLTADEIARIKDNRVRKLPGTYEANRSVLATINDILLYRRPDDYVRTLKAKTESVDLASAQSALAQVLKSQPLTLIVVGDLSKVEAPVRALGLGDVEVMDADGRVLRH